MPDNELIGRTNTREFGVTDAAVGSSIRDDQVGGSSGVANNWFVKLPVPRMTISPVYLSKLPKPEAAVRLP
ncbi:hypothetical protein [Bacillus sp. JCM 19034]|uniref:hypothetical protein n=1 Tax=Bacillus sp. JCM 19034 TaxID=1481928 RepID=UPI000785B55D|nr:hypothetical protein [Bacillus sp. JCM 19034]